MIYLSIWNLRSVYGIPSLAWGKYKAALAGAETWCVLSTTWPSRTCTAYKGFVCWSFKSWQNLRSYQNGYRLVAVHTHGKVTVPHHWEIWPLPPWPNFPLKSNFTDTELAWIFTILLITTARLGGDKYQFCTPLVWLGWDQNSWPSVLYRSCHHVRWKHK